MEYCKPIEKENDEVRMHNREPKKVGICKVEVTEFNHNQHLLFKNWQNLYHWVCKWCCIEISFGTFISRNKILLKQNRSSIKEIKMLAWLISKGDKVCLFCLKLNFKKYMQRWVLSGVLFLFEFYLKL